MPSASAPSPALSILDLPRPYLVFLGEAGDFAFAKTAFGLRDWAPERCVGEYACPEATVSVNLPVLEPAEAHARGARSMVIGVDATATNKVGGGVRNAS